MYLLSATTPYQISYSLRREDSAKDFEDSMNECKECLSVRRFLLSLCEIFYSRLEVVPTDTSHKRTEYYVLRQIDFKGINRLDSAQERQKKRDGKIK